MAKELALGIKDNVEDIAAAFKKMAVINPNREKVRPEILPIVAAVEEPSEPITLPVPTETESPMLGTLDVDRKQTVYDGLLQRTIEERRKKKSKKNLVDENQFSLFDFVA